MSDAPRQVHVQHGHTPFLPGECKAVCRDCGNFIEAKLGHPNGQRCDKCHASYLEHVREDNRIKANKKKYRRCL